MVKVVNVVVPAGVLVNQRGARSEAKAEAAKVNKVNEVFMMLEGDGLMDSEGYFVDCLSYRTKVLSNRSEGVTYCWRLESRAGFKEGWFA